MLYLSLYFKQNRSEYYRLLGQLRTAGDWEGSTFGKRGVDGTEYGAELIHDTALASLHGELAEAVTSEELAARV